MLALIQALHFKTLSILQDVRRPDLLAEGDWGFAGNDGAPTIFVPGGEYGIALREEIEVFGERGITREQFEELFSYGEECSRALSYYEDVVAIHQDDLGEREEWAHETNARHTRLGLAEQALKNPIAGLR